MGRFSILEREELLFDYKRSGLKISAFCRLRGVNIKTFGNWKRQFIDGIAPTPSPSSSSSRKTNSSKVRASHRASQNSCDNTISPPDIHPLEVIDDTAFQAQGSHKPQTITLHFPNGVTAHIANIDTHEIIQLINNYHQCSR